MNNAQNTPQQLNLEDLAVSLEANPVVKPKRWRAEKTASAEEDLASGLAVKIRLTKGFEAIVDAADMTSINQWKWRIHDSNPKYKYAFRRTSVRINGKRKHTAISLHRFVLQMGSSRLIVDHRNGNPLDNRRSNLRIATYSENARNSYGYCRKKFKGIKREGRGWTSRINVNGKLFETYGFCSEEAAARDYDEKAIAHFGAYACLNFPID